MKENLIREYIMSINFNRDDWKVSDMVSDMKRFLGEEPGISIQWEKDAVLNEATGESEVFEKVKKISIIFTDTSDKFKKLEFLVDSPR
jgi:hypothetical protein